MQRDQYEALARECEEATSEDVLYGVVAKIHGQDQRRYEELCRLLDAGGALSVAAKLVPDGCNAAMGDLNEDNVPWACVTENEGDCRDFTGRGAFISTSLAAASMRAMVGLEAG